MLYRRVIIVFILGKRSGVAHTLIERSRISTAHPRVRKDDLLRGVRDGCWEFTTLEERNVKTQVEHVLKTVVDVNSAVFFKKKVYCLGDQCPGREKRRTGILQEILRPFEAICMELVGVSGSPHCPPAERLRHSVQPCQGPPVQRPSDVVDASAKRQSLSETETGENISSAYCAGYVGPLPRASMISISPEIGDASRHGPE
jgi:hypothetical protein